MAVCVVWQNFLVWWYSVGGIAARAPPHSHYQAGCWVVACIFSNPQSKCTHSKFCGRLCLCADKKYGTMCEYRFLGVKASSGPMKRIPRARFQSEFKWAFTSLARFSQQAKTSWFNAILNSLILNVSSWIWRGCMISPCALLHCTEAKGSERLPRNTLT